MEGGPERGRGRCRGAFFAALLAGAAGLAALLAGALSDAACADLLLYGGGGGLLLSLLGWVLWLAGNLEVPPAELEDDVGLGPPGKPARRRRRPRLLRSLSRRLSGPCVARLALALARPPAPEPAPEPA